MKTDREKLIKLLSVLLIPNGMCANPAEVVADYLLANGVTFATDTNVGSKWISVKDRLPDEGEVVMCYHKAFGYPVFCQWDESDLCWVNNDWTFGRGLITHWMPLPEPPKEGR